MKIITFLSMMVCFTFIFATISCEKSGNQAQSLTIGQNWPISAREPLDECADCPVGCCCCGIENLISTGYTIQLCGLCEGDYLCGTYSPSSPCSTVSGVGKDITFNVGHTREIFCVEPGASFRVYNPSPSLAVTFRFTCQYNVTPNTFLTITLQPHEERFFYNDGSCITEGC